MLLRARRTHLPSLRQARRVIVASRTLQTLTRAVLRMTEADAISRSVSRSARERLRRVTNATRTQVAAVRLRVRRVATVTTGVRVQSRRNRQRLAMTRRRTMTSDAACLRSRVVFHEI